MIPAPAGWVVDPTDSHDAELLRAATITVALQQYGQVLITRECLAWWPSLSRLDLDVLAQSANGVVTRYDDMKNDGVMLKVVRFRRHHLDKWVRS